MSNIAKIAQISLSNARSCLESKNYGRSFANFLLFLKLNSDDASDVYMEFALSSREWFKQLENEQRLGDLFKSYDQACELYPNHEMVLNNIGEQLFRLGYIQEAAAYIRKSLLINPEYLSARSNLENICGHLVERWHFAMLNDRRRNVAYRFAIQKAIKSGYNTVLDIGTGTGILSLVCEQSGAQQVTACDGSRAMVDVARDVVAASGAQEKITLLHKHSSNLQIPRDLPARVKLMVTETFDAGLFGEHIVSTLIYAWKNLISTSPTGSVIPCGATMYMCGIECEAVRTKSRLLYPVLQHLDLSSVDLVCTTGHITDEPYTTENLAKIRGGYKILTNITELLRVSFCNLCELESLHKGRDWLSELYVRKSGRLDALAVWFDLHLDDTITIATGADTESCWEQAIYPITSIHRQDPTDHNNCHVRKKDALRTHFHFQQDCLRLTKCELVEELPSESSSTNQSRSCDNSSGHVTSNFGNDHHMTPGQTLSSAGCGVSVKECSKHSLPFRKRKVEEQESDNESESMLPWQHGSCAQCDDVDIDNKGHPSAKQSLDSKGQNLSGANYPDIDDESKASLLSDDLIRKSESEFEEIPADEKSCTCEDEIKSLPNQTINSDLASGGDLSDVHIFMGKCSLGNTGNRDAYLPHASSTDVQKVTCLAEHADIQYVNDIELNRQYCHVLETFFLKHPGEKLSLLYITPRLSFLGIQAMKMGYCSVTMATSEEHHDTLQQVAALNGCKTGEITLLDLCELNDLEVKVDLVISDLVEPCGALRQQALIDLVYHRVTGITEIGMVLPQEIKVHGLFIASEELENLNRVTGDDKTLGFHIADYMNVFQMQNHLNIDMSTLSYTKLTDVTELLSIDFTAITLESGPDVLDFCLERSVEVTSSGKVSAMIYWFEIRLDKDTVVNTLDCRCHWKQAGIMMADEVTVCQGQVLVAKVMLQNSCLDVKIVKSD